MTVCLILIVCLSLDHRVYSRLSLSTHRYRLVSRRRDLAERMGSPRRPSGLPLRSLRHHPSTERGHQRRSSGDTAAGNRLATVCAFKYLTHKLQSCLSPTAHSPVRPPVDQFTRRPARRPAVRPPVGRSAGRSARSSPIADKFAL